jgi:LCP family protein required for cell wall assembly
VFLILGSDEKPTDPDIRADAILLLLVPEDRSASMLISVPRALYVTSPCTGRLAAINLNLEGCGTVSGLDLMGVAVEDYTGLTIDHLVLFDFGGFETIIDRIGGLEVCVEHAIKVGAEAPIFLEPGCSIVSGTDALRWVRERQMLERIDGEWRLMAGAGDAGRTERQRDMIRRVIEKADRFESPGALFGLVSELSDSFALDDGLSLGEAIDLAWELRVLGGRPAFDLSVATLGAVSSDGEFILIPEEPFSTYLERLPTG